MGFGRVLSMFTMASLCCGCQLIEGAPRVPKAERALATEADAPPQATADLESAGGANASDSTNANGDDEPDLASSSSDDEHSDETPGEGPPPTTPSFDQSGTPIASRYAGLDRVSCEAELDRRHVPYTRVGEARGVIAPLRLTGPLSGVTFRSQLPAKMRASATMEIYDCRLVLALDDFAKVLAKHDIVEVIHLSVYRPVSSKTPLKGGAGRRHGGALAIDAGFFKTKDGRTLNVEKDFHGRIGAHPCPARADATELRQIACEANDARLFNVLLTPDYNWAHRNHFHMEVTANVRWTLVR